LGFGYINYFLVSICVQLRLLATFQNHEVVPIRPANPNGSVQNIAGVCNDKRNVMGMMPHPERAADANLLNTDGVALFESLLNYTVSL